MAAFQILLSNLGLSGLRPVVYRAGFGQPLPQGVERQYPEQEGGTTGNLTGESADASPKSWLGLPVFADVRFPREGKDDIKLETVLVDVAQRKNIVVTPVQGRNGTVKEYVSDGDYEVRIRGAIVTASNNRYPDDRVRELHDLLSLPQTLTVVSEFLRLFRVYSLVVTGFDFRQAEGTQNTQLFEIEAISDLPEELIEDD